MFSKKDDFTNDIQYKLGERIDGLDSTSYSTINDLCEIFEQQNNTQPWNGLSFLNYYFQLKKIVETKLSESVDSTFDLNSKLTKQQKEELLIELNKLEIKPIELSRSPKINLFISLFTLASILGTMLISTLLITVKGYSGWTYLSGLIGLVLSVLLFKLTAKSKHNFLSGNILQYAKSTYVIRHKTLSKTTHQREDLIAFINEELNIVFGKTFKVDELIPEN
jgi:hypothetical protein